MNLINQINSETGCGVATFAMATGFKNFDGAFEKMKSEGWILNSGNVQTTQMLLALQSTFGKENIQVKNKEPTDAKKYLLFVKYKENYRHWVFVYNGNYYDPLPRFKKYRKSISYKITRAYIING